ncbi:hypothetical protein NJ959_13965 [Symplocastrum sp. BBK-W-15]|uniref:Uncharacterized protein n=1 Tax=Limnofasciculus baicalensis BBK-W-15 TaxID=2699891 RepID=A0AAE3KN88_9CYAN|nr:hypothetical protein [Limnofasciculus baicalensis BBK-W-15]
MSGTYSINSINQRENFSGRVGTDWSLTGLSAHDLAQSEILQVAKTQLESQGYCIFSTGNTEKSIILDLADCMGYQ